MKSIDLKMVSVEVKAETRPLRAQSAEMVKELNSFYSIDVESELERLLVNEIKKEERKSSIRKIYGS
jgi:hypothetical protein